MKNLVSYFKNAKAYIWKDKFAVARTNSKICPVCKSVGIYNAKTKKFVPGAFATIKDKNETTTIISQAKIKNKDVLEIENGWRIITFDAVLPFGLVGFLARISSALAEDKIPIFVVSAYSTDHVLVKGKDLAKAKKKLEKLGFKLRVK